MPARTFDSLPTFLAWVQQHPALTLDVTAGRPREVRIQRPQEKQAQKDHYSGKKCHTKKALILKGNTGKILYVSKRHKGTTADYEILKKECPPEQPWFKEKEVRLDLGFDSDYTCQRLRKPQKRKRVAKGLSNELSPEQKAYNKVVSAERVAIEHCIRQMKQVRMIQQTIRIRKGSLLNRIVGLSAALANFKVM